VAHAFTNRLFLVSIDLDQVDRVFRIPLLWSTRRFSLIRFCRTDYFGDPQRPLADWVREIVGQRPGRSVTGPIQLVTQVRLLGFVFNPISLYYCHDESGEHPEAVVAEVTNTPWGEKHCYVIDCRESCNNGHRVIRSETTKELHVSPFMPMAMTYRWRLTRPDQRLSVHLENHDSRGRVFDATLLLQRRNLTLFNTTKMLIGYPFMSVYVVIAIYWQALWLWLKNVPFVPHPRHVASS